MTDGPKYTSTLKLNQKTVQKNLDMLIDGYDGIPASNGYIDIIILRERYVDFINALTELNLAIECVSWWCLATDENKEQYGCPHGYGGPMTKFGWFSELSHDFDEIEKKEIERLECEYSSERVRRINEIAAAIIKDKRTITYGDGSYLVFARNTCLTPAFWIRVPDDWERQEKV
ncbi:MAG: hypothetical protein GY861_01360 [bacterium]|nr:hypothetical protein [bacterium]